MELLTKTECTVAVNREELPHRVGALAAAAEHRLLVELAEMTMLVPSVKVALAFSDQVVMVELAAAAGTAAVVPILIPLVMMTVVAAAVPAM